ncbi:hypothetical protein TREMEDRAFT_58373 [Tremella mesenterica DSM 1558]|uniref:uncharacterized protein n=1 Tax=Tremella mesenterica (strain ATCC 24925 / CBS 8224 / DSM 1558 / NBRC 9311 / NRRL Y-6157 / RJB 2259-6 / UBC 559-6) TaxID=578456 RepID=UPI0003F48D62|nr:uncharacterized protein TREMEDRAFT_58373 [Tremella mesenterica DSM 1558]EIW72213.1 hypothetical protein TREMEDRAFT_58373 [Tremella mesenterica DSM 1558]
MIVDEPRLTSPWIAEEVQRSVNYLYSPSLLIERPSTPAQPCAQSSLLNFAVPRHIPDLVSVVRVEVGDGERKVGDGERRIGDGGCQGCYNVVRDTPEHSSLPVDSNLMEFKGLDAILKLIHRLDNAKLVMTPAFSESFLQGQSNDGNRVKLYLPNQDQLQESLGNMPLNFVLVNGEHNALSFPQWPATPDITGNSDRPSISVNRVNKVGDRGFRWQLMLDYPHRACVTNYVVTPRLFHQQ